jgi:hypothetical protein
MALPVMSPSRKLGAGLTGVNADHSKKVFFILKTQFRGGLP